MNDQLFNQVIGLSLIYAKESNLPINTKIITDKNKMPLVGYKAINNLCVIDFAHHIVSIIFNKSFIRNASNDWKALNIYYMKMLNIEINVNKSVKYMSIPFIRVEDINTLIVNNFGLNLYSLVDCYKEYLNFFSSVKIPKQRRHDLSYVVCFSYKDIERIVNKKIQENKTINRKEIEKINMTIRNIDNILYDNN